MTRLRVAVDARTLQDHPLTGVGRMLAHVLPGVEQAVDVDLLLRRDGFAVDHPHGHVLGAPSRRWAVWLETAPPRFLQGYPGIFHCPYYGLPRIQPVPMVVTVHDLSFEHHPEWHSIPQRAAYRAQARHASRTARVVLTPSTHVARELGERYAVPAERVMVAPHAVPPHFRVHTPDEIAVVRRRHQLPDAYLVALGGRHRRRLDVAVTVRSRLAARGIDVPLVVIGGDTIGNDRDALHRRNLPDGDWAAVLAGATALVYPTVYEGFGFPAIEALASGTPVVAARVASLPEVLGDVAAWAADINAESFTDAARRLLEDTAYAADLARRGLARAAARRSWQPSVDMHLAAYHRAADGAS